MEDRPTPTVVLHHLPLSPSLASFDPVLHYFSSVNTPEPLSSGLLHKLPAKVYLFLFLQLPLYTSFFWGCLLGNARPVVLHCGPWASKQQRLLESCKKCKFSDLTPDLLPQKL